MGWSTEKCLRVLSGHIDDISCAVWLSKNKIISCSGSRVTNKEFFKSQCPPEKSDYNTLKVWDLSTGQCLQTLYGHRLRVSCILRLSDEYVISSSEDKMLKVWNTVTGKCLMTLQNDYVINCIAKLKTNRVIGGCHYSGILKTWELTGLNYLALAEIRKNTTILKQAYRTQTGFFNLLPTELCAKISGLTTAASFYDKEVYEEAARKLLSP